MAQATVLIVDDDPALRRTLQLRLREEGLRVVDADSAERALALLAVELPDLVVTDVRMGGMDGLALFDEIRRDHPLLPVIILTAHGTIADAVGTTRKGVAAYLTKPVEAATLLAEVRRALASGRREDLGMTAPADGLYLEHIQLENAGHDAWPAIDEGALVA